MSVIDVVISTPPVGIISNASEPVALNIGEPETKISLKWEPIDTNAVPGTDSLTFKPVLSSNCNFVNCLLYVLPSTSEPEIWNGTFINPSALPLNADALTEPDDNILKLVNIPPFGTTKLEDSILTLEPLKGAILLTLNKPSIITEPVISVLVLILNPSVCEIDAVALPSTILFNSNPVTPLDGILYSWLPSPLNDPEKFDAVTFPVMKIEPVLTVFVEINSSTDGPREPETAI